MMCVPFVACPHFGVGAVQCWDNNKHVSNIVRHLGTALDCVTWIIGKVPVNHEVILFTAV
jgi:hypothetical protein